MTVSGPYLTMVVGSKYLANDLASYHHHPRLYATIFFPFSCNDTLTAVERCSLAILYRARCRWVDYLRRNRFVLIANSGHWQSRPYWYVVRTSLLFACLILSSFHRVRILQVELIDTKAIAFARHGGDSAGRASCLYGTA